MRYLPRYLFTGDSFSIDSADEKDDAIHRFVDIETVGETGANARPDQSRRSRSFEFRTLDATCFLRVQTLPLW